MGMGHWGWAGGTGDVPAHTHTGAGSGSHPEGTPAGLCGSRLAGMWILPAGIPQPPLLVGRAAVALRAVNLLMGVSS